MCYFITIIPPGVETGIFLDNFVKTVMVVCFARSYCTHGVINPIWLTTHSLLAPPTLDYTLFMCLHNSTPIFLHISEATSPGLTTTFFPVLTTESTFRVTTLPTDELPSTVALTSSLPSDGVGSTILETMTAETTWPPWIQTSTPDMSTPVSGVSSSQGNSIGSASLDSTESSDGSTKGSFTEDIGAVTTDFVRPSTTWPMFLPSSTSAASSSGSIVYEDQGTTTVPGSFDLSSSGVTRPQTTWPWNMPTFPSTAMTMTTSADESTGNLVDTSANTTDDPALVTTDSLTPSGNNTASLTPELSTVTFAERSTSVADVSTGFILRSTVSTMGSFSTTRGTEASTLTGDLTDVLGSTVSTLGSFSTTRGTEASTLTGDQTDATPSLDSKRSRTVVNPHHDVAWSETLACFITQSSLKPKGSLVVPKVDTVLPMLMVFFHDCAMLSHGGLLLHPFTYLSISSILFFTWFMIYILLVIFSVKLTFLSDNQTT